MLDFLGDLRRTHMCGTLRPSDAGKKAVLMGWVNRRRDHGNLLFIDLRDRTGIAQIVFNAERDTAIHEKAGALRNEYVIAVIGTVKLRDAKHYQQEHADRRSRTGRRRVTHPQRIEAAAIPALRHRAHERRNAPEISLHRSPPGRDAVQHRDSVTKSLKPFAIIFRDEGFFEIETPFMTRSTPEGARDYLVPSRVQPGNFLRAAAIAADVQTNSDDLRLR